jgi:DNA-binding HxlR family transcriptional regulator
VEPLLPRREATEERPSVSEPSSPDRNVRINELFRRFREPVVRLVEQVTDELGPPAGPSAEAQRDIRLVRSAFGKWSAELLVALHAKPATGFEDLRRTLTGISARVLSIKLNELEESGMIHREVVDTRPPRVRYSLTERGWTVAWLARPILLYLRVTESPAPARLPQADKVEGPERPRLTLTVGVPAADRRSEFVDPRPLREVGMPAPSRPSPMPADRSKSRRAAAKARRPSKRRGR